MNLDIAMNEFDKTNVQVNELIMKREKLKNLILELQGNVRADGGESVFRMDQSENISPRQKFKNDTDDMWKKEYQNDAVEGINKNELSPRDQLNDDLRKMWK